MVRLAFVGAGNIAHHHLKAFRLAGAEVVGVCTRGETGPTFAETYGIRHYSPSLPDLIEHCQPDAVLVLTHPSQYASILEMLQPYNLPTLLEKPVALTSEMAQALEPLLPQKVFVALNRRFYGNIQAIYPLLQDEPPFMAQLALPERLKDFEHRDRITRDYWYVLNGIHGVDLITYLTGLPVSVEHHAHWGTLTDCAMSQYYSTIYTTARHHRIYFMANFDSPGGWRIHAFLKQREVIISPFEKTYLKTLSGIEELPTVESDVVAKPGFLSMAKTFLQGVESTSDLPTGWIDFHQAVQTIQAAETLFGVFHSSLTQDEPVFS